MKRFILNIALILVLLAALSVALTGCGQEPEASKTTQKSEKPTEQTVVFDPSMFNIYFDNEYLCAVVVPEEPTPIEDLVIKELGHVISKQTGKVIDVISDGESVSKYEWLILLGNTKYSESGDAYKALENNSAIAQVKNKRLVIAFSDLSSGMGITNAISSALKEDYYGTARLKADYSEAYSSLRENGVPKLEHADEILGSGEGTRMNYFSTVSETELSYYCEEILSAGFEKISEREEKGNKFFTYLSDKAYVYVYYTAHSKDLRVLSGPADTLASADYSSDLARDKAPFIASIPQPDSGQGYILRLPDGRYLIHDGGYEKDDRVYAALRELQPEGDIVIAAWFISHPHGDHYPAFVDFIKDHYKDETIKIERVIYNFTAAERYNIDGSAGVEWGGIGVRKFHEAMEQYAPDLPLIKAHTGQVMDFGSAKVEILLTVEDILPAEMNNTNDSSMVIRVEMGGSSIILLADTSYASGPKLNKMWGDYLKSDMVQVAHHGMWPSVAEIYHSIKAEVLLYSTTYKHLRYHIKETAQWGDVNKVILQYAKDIYVSDDKIEKIMLPYTVQNNKDQMLDYIINYK